MVLIAINVVVFLLCRVTPSLTVNLSLVPLYVKFRHYYWQFFTYMFVSGSVMHLLSNMIALLVFGRVVEHAVGTKEFLLYYFLTGVLCSGAAYAYSAFAGRYQMVILGASGAIYAVMLLFAVILPQAVVLVFGIIPVRAPILVLFYFLLDFFGQFSSDGIAHNVHLFGIFFGTLYMLIRMRMNPLKAWGIMD
ncbi:MAG: rhomboid family intramembrane serine protease [Spirochaetales bacterium]|nr:rhomboid family intramembrane serine protease [Candidatus Physcosoma equi]